MIIVTGGAGFIGSVLVKELNKNGHKDIIVVDRLRDGDKWLNLRGAKFDQFINADDLFANHSHIFSRASKIFHIGACSTTTERDVDYLLRNNFEYSKELFKIATKYQVPFIYASSAATYGDGASGYSDNYELLDTLLPLNAYGYSKQLFDEWVLKQKKTPPLWFGLKYFNVYGPNEYHKGSQSSVVFQLYNQLKKEKEIKLFKSDKEEYKDGEQRRDFVYVIDVVKAMVELSCLQNGDNSTILNIGTGEAKTFNELANAVFDSLNIEPNIKYIDAPAQIARHYQYYTQAEMSKFNALLPNFKFTPLKNGISDYIKNYLMKDNIYY